MKSPLNWNDPSKTWKAASYQPFTERRSKAKDPRDAKVRAAIGERRENTQRLPVALRRL